MQEIGAGGVGGNSWKGRGDRKQEEREEPSDGDTGLTPGERHEKWAGGACARAPPGQRGAAEQSLPMRQAPCQMDMAPFFSLHHCLRVAWAENGLSRTFHGPEFSHNSLVSCHCWRLSVKSSALLGKPSLLPQVPGLHRGRFRNAQRPRIHPVQLQEILSPKSHRFSSLSESSLNRCLNVMSREGNHLTSSLSNHVANHS